MYRVLSIVILLLTFAKTGFADSWEDVPEGQVKPVMEILKNHPFIISYCRGCDENSGSLIRVDSAYTADSQGEKGSKEIIIKGEVLYILESGTPRFADYIPSAVGDPDYTTPLSLNYNLAFHEELKWAVPFCKLIGPGEDDCPVEAVGFPSPQFLARHNLEVDQSYLGWWVNTFDNKNPEYSIPVPADKRTWQHIVADVANARSQPKAGAEIVARLKIGTSFKIMKTKEEWAYIDSAYGQAIGGWVHQTTYGETPVDKNYIIGRINQAPTFADTIKWCERMVALLPDDKEYAKALQKGYIALGDTLRAQALGQKLRGKDPTYIAQRHGNQIRLRGVIDSLGEFRSLEWTETPNNGWVIYDEEGKARKKEALQSRWALAAIPWYAYVGSKVESFAAPQVLPTAEELKSGTLSKYYQDFNESIMFGISLGTAPEYSGNIFATKPLHPVTVNGILKKTELESIEKYKKQLVQTAFDASGLTEIHYSSLPEYDYIDIAVCGNLSANGGGRGQQRGIFDQKRQCVWPPEGQTITQAESYDPARSGPYDPYKTALNSAWFRFGPDASSPAFSIVPYSSNYSIPSFEAHNGDFGLHLVRISKTGSKTFTIRSEYAGD